MRHRRSPERVVKNLAAIPKLTRAELIELWTAAYSRPSPQGLSRRLLEYAGAYHLQAQAFGGHCQTKSNQSVESGKLGISGRKLAPLSERCGAVLLEDFAVVEVAVLVEVVVDRGMGGGEFL